jgi:hypothetical protein
MRTKAAMILVSLAATAFVIWIVIQNKRQSDYEKQPPVIQAVSEIEKNLRESDQKTK